MRRAAPALAGALCVASLVAGDPAALAAPAAAPPDLQRLEQAMLGLQVTSQRFEASLDIGGPAADAAIGPLGNFRGGRLAHLATVVPFTSAVGEVSYSPRAASYEASLFGLKTKERLIGDTRYTYEPFLATVDGGRPWVREHDDGNEGGESLGVIELGAAEPTVGGEAGSEFRALAKLLDGAKSITELGPQVLDAQSTTGFRAVLSPALPKHPDAATRRDLRSIRVVGLTAEVYFAEDGLPVRTRVRSEFKLRRSGRHFEVVAQTDTLAFNMPVSVVAPPAAKTIGERELIELLSRRSEGHRRSRQSR